MPDKPIHALSDPKRYGLRWETMTAFVDSCVQALAGSASAAERQSRGRPRARKLLRTLANKKNILVTTHIHPDPNASGSG